MCPATPAQPVRSHGGLPTARTEEALKDSDQIQEKTRKRIIRMEILARWDSMPIVLVALRLYESIVNIIKSQAPRNMPLLYAPFAVEFGTALCLYSLLDA